MSNTIAHLAVAAEILKLNPLMIKNKSAYYLGAIAPDTIGSKPNVTRNDKKIVHLREEISDIDWLKADCMNVFDLRINEFVNSYIKFETNENQRDFNIGYLVHLLTDKWNHKTIRQKMLKYAKEKSIEEKDKAFFHMMINDLEALDNYLLEQNDEIKTIFDSLCDNTFDYELEIYIKKEYIERSIEWWKNEYLSNIKTKFLEYLSFTDIDEFIKISSKRIVDEIKILLEVPYMDEKELLKLSARELVDLGICPTCFNKKHNGALYGDNSDKLLYEDNEIECFFVGNPRADGHMCISTIDHYHDMSEAPDYINEKIIRFAKQFMIIIKEVYGCERVYMCTMCDGPNNHYHIQLIPRYGYEKRGSKNFVKERHSYVYDEEKFNNVKKLINEYVGE